MATAGNAKCRGHLQTEKTVKSEAGMRHRLSNETEEPLVIIKVQTADYLGEGGEVRYEDIYNRQSSQLARPLQS